ncbi:MULTISPECIES: helix-turn-helix transcriptional regulator [Planococcus]|uniref:XRE family transcriptional regulator n=2 Tax=Planococcus TaxID=1372 RepID=A0ABM5WXZ1_9BACL|nr:MULTISPECIES: helix-turn-helix transcriptional regulator [Planococcus]ALS79192.1 XRE family transcriptional regulator [Planococcus kocurii]AQU78841.1 transcriptional regulator [Planococcus faecalis]KAA0956604.1 helix-turn-helix transcriptional regulator [Planococcus sp. ANT_H30]MDJ0332048.1 helix-turn-helix transcriptional regulator [Planococcus sp. S3-L1]OHX52921.1 transcriptional regulator [Planococcus faecalis]
MKNDLHAQLKALREERGLSLDELALKTRIGVAKLQAYESGEEVPSTQTIMILSNALEVPASNLVDGLESN